jgi:tryptophanyl-tRNA synthetase
VGLKCLDLGHRGGRRTGDPAVFAPQAGLRAGARSGALDVNRPPGVEGQPERSSRSFFVRLRFPAVRIFSGIQPTGSKHLGNYIGAIRQYVEGQDRGDPAIYCIVDLHAISVAYDPAELRERVYDTTAVLVAAGLEPERCVLFRQSDVQEHTELCWLLSSVTAVGELNRMHQFRDKSVGQRELVSAALLFYPVLQAADVLAYRAHEVPVGDDQREHLELMRDIARRFNARFGEDILVVPEHRIPDVGARIMDLQEPANKMSTTGGTPEGTVLVLDEPAIVERKIKRAVTDSGSDIVRAPDKPGVTNLIDILAVARGVSPEAVEEEMRSARGYGDLKTATAQAVVEMLAPVRERYAELRADEQRLEAILAEGAEKARAMARPVLADVRAAMGFAPSI